MAVLGMGAGLDSLNNTSGAIYEIASGEWVRQGVHVSGGSEYAETPAWPAVQEIWFSIETGIGIEGTIFTLMDGTTEAFKVSTTSSRNIKIEYNDVGSWTQIGSSINSPGGPRWLTVYLKTGASGEAILFIDGVERTSGSASITTAPNITSVRRYRGDNYIRSYGWIAADESTVTWRNTQGYPSGNGANTAWVGDYTAVDETILNDADYIYSGTADQVETFQQTLVADLDGYVPRAVCVTARVLRGSSGPQNVQLVLRSGGTDYFSPTKTVGLGYSVVQHVWNTNPDTGLDWTSSQIASLQMGVKSIA